MKNPGVIAKAIIAAIVAGGAAAQTALLDGVITESEWVTVALAVIVTGGAVFTTPNSPTEPKPVENVDGRHEVIE